MVDSLQREHATLNVFIKSIITHNISTGCTVNVNVNANIMFVSRRYAFRFLFQKRCEYAANLFHLIPMYTSI